MGQSRHQKVLSRLLKRGKSAERLSHLTVAEIPKVLLGFDEDLDGVHCTF